MKEKLFVAMGMGLVLFLMSGASDAKESDRKVIEFNYPGGGVFTNRFARFVTDIGSSPTQIIIDRKTGCEFIINEQGGIQPTTPLDQCPKENIKPYNAED